MFITQNEVHLSSRERRANRKSREFRRAVVRNVGDVLFVAAVAIPGFALLGVAMILSASAAGWM
jgi:hypothetical protein